MRIKGVDIGSQIPWAVLDTDTVNVGGVWGKCAIVPDFAVPNAYINHLSVVGQSRNEVTLLRVSPVYELLCSSASARNDLNRIIGALITLDGNLDRSEAWGFDDNKLPGTDEDAHELTLGDFVNYRLDSTKRNYKRLFLVPIKFFMPPKNELGEVSL